MANKLKIYNGNTWEPVAIGIPSSASTVSNTFTGVQIIKTASDIAASRNLKVINDGAGDLIELFRNESPGVLTRRYNGTYDSPTAVLANQRSGYIIGSTYDGLTYSNNSAINMYASENQTSTARGSYITFDTTNTGTVGRTEKMRITDSGRLGIGTVSPSNKLHVVTSDDYSTATFESSGAEVNISLKTTSANGRDWRIVSGGSTGGFSGGLFGLYDATAAAIRFYITSNGSAVFNNTNGEFLSQINGVSKFQVTNGAVKIWAGRGGLEGGEMYLASTGGTNGYNNNSDAVFDVYDGSVRLSADGFGKIYYLRPVADNGTTVGIRNVTASTSNPSGGQDGDMWAVYV